MGRLFDVGSSMAASLARAGSGFVVGSLGERPEQPIELYEFESCPFCRKVREALTVLDLDAAIRPCPKGGERYRPGVIERGGKAQFPYLVDPNADVEMYESDAIVRHLFERYGDGRVPLLLSVPLWTNLSASLASALRAGAGTHARPSRAPERALELWSFELSPYSRLVRELLCELELPYTVHNLGRRSAQRPAFAERAGRMMVPFLFDPNTDVEMFESADISAYLKDTYALPPGGAAQ